MYVESKSRPSCAEVLLSAVDGVDAADDCGHGVLVELPAVGIREELLVARGGAAPLDKFVNAAGLIPIVHQG